MGTRKVVVIGSGNAGFAAAIAAVEKGAKVVLLEKAPEPEYGGNSRFTAGLIRFGFDDKSQVRKFVPQFSDAQWDKIKIHPYPVQRYIDDLKLKSQGKADPNLISWLAQDSYSVMEWLVEHNVQWTFLTYIPNAMETGFGDGIVLETVGGGPGIVEMERAEALRLGVEIRYESTAYELVINDKGAVTGVKVRGPDGVSYVEPGAVVMASGGFEANPEMRTRYLGPGWNVVKVRGVRYNTGDMLDPAIRAGAQANGHWAGCHCTTIDPDSPELGTLESSDKTNKIAFSWGISVNAAGERFIDEGKDWNTKMYVSVGNAVAQQGGRAFQVFDAVGFEHLDQRYDPSAAIIADTLDELAEQAGIDPQGLRHTVDRFNVAVQDDVPFDPRKLDGRSTVGISPPKTNWATRIEKPPFVCYGVVTGITFTFGGLTVDRNGQVLDQGNHPIPGLYAAGEMTGGFFYYQYPAGSGLMCGALTGRAAGWHAAQAPTEAR
jgi:tricarballylate dehydrogenase